LRPLRLHDLRTIEVVQAEFTTKHLLIGFDIKLNLIEILYNVLDDEKIRVFHAMKCTEKYLKLVNR